MDSDTVKFFVYGTLKKGGHFAGGVSKYLKSVKRGTIKGTMYNASGWYPAVVAGGDGVVQGEIQEFNEPSKVHIILDRIEGCHGDNPNNLYNKVEVDVTDEDGNVETCLLYEFNRPVDKLTVVEDGNWPI